MKKLVKLAVIIIVAVVLQIGANEHAFNERGYKATGGEVLVFPVALYLGYKIFLSEDDYAVDDEEEEGTEPYYRSQREERTNYGKHVNRRVS